MTLSSIEDELDLPEAVAWKPAKQGEKLVGRVLAVYPRDGVYGEYLVVEVLDHADGSVKALHAFRKLLAEKIDQLKPARGDEIGVKFLGEVTPPGGGSRYWNFRVIVHKQPASEPGAGAAASLPTPRAVSADEPDEPPFDEYDDGPF